MPTISILPGDGIGPEVMREARKVLDAISEKFDNAFEYKEGLIGGAAYDEYGEHLPQATIDMCKASDAILFGSVGGPVEKQDEPKWKDAEKNAILGIRKMFNLAVNLRPVTVYPMLAHLSPLKPEIIEKGIDLLVVRELVSGIYFGEHKNDGYIATDVMSYTTEEIKRPMKFAFEAATLRRKKVTVVDKANVLDCSRLWRQVTEKVAADFPEIELEYMYIDNAMQQVIKNPSQFDVVATSNLFGDIFSDACAVLPGSLGLMPSASLGDTLHLYEPIGGSAPHRTGKNTANPIAQILSAALMLRYSFDMEEEAQTIEDAVQKVLEDGKRTTDLIRDDTKPTSTTKMGDAIVQHISSP